MKIMNILRCKFFGYREDGQEERAKRLKANIKREATIATKKIKQLNTALEERSFYIATAIGYNGKHDGK